MTSPTRLAGRVRTWPLWSASPRLAGLVVATTVLALVAAAVTLPRTPHLTRGDWAAWLVLAGCAGLSIEGVRRLGQPAGVSKDLLSVWAVPIALLLPPLCVLLLPIPVMVLRQYRVGRSLVHRRVFSAAAIGLADWVVSVLFHRYLAWSHASFPEPGRAARTELLVVALVCAWIGCAVNVLLVGTAVRTAAPGTTWRELLVDGEQRTIDAGEICLGVLVAVCWLVLPVLVVVLLLPVLLVQRSLSHAQLRAAARLDPKTGLLNAKAWQGEAEREIVRAHREHQPLAVLIADLDGFKAVNDAHGHLVGDTAIMSAVTALTGGLRPYDQLGRFGGEEFTVVLPRTGSGEAARVAERLRRAVADTQVRAGDVPVALTVSIGVSVLGEHGTDLTDLLAAADHALYRAKDAGRNQVALAH